MLRWHRASVASKIRVLKVDQDEEKFCFIYVVSPPVHSDAFCLILVHWGLDKPLLKIQGGHKMKKCSPEKVSLIKCLRIDTLYTQNLDFITHELTCSRYDLAKVDFWQIQKLKISLLRKKVTC